MTGGGTGLGRATALELARCGARVTIAGRRAEVLEQAAAEIDAGGEAGEQAGAIDWVAGDVRERADARAADRDGARAPRAPGRARQQRGRAVLQPGRADRGEGLAGGVAAERGGHAEHVRGGVRARARARRGAGTVVNVTLSPHHGMPGMAHSGAARATRRGADARARRSAGRRAGVAVTAVAAGHFDTEVLAKYPGERARGRGAHGAAAAARHASHEHAWLVALLASPLGRAFSGSTITLDGARDNWFGPWPPPGLADEAGEVPVEERGRGRRRRRLEAPLGPGHARDLHGGPAKRRNGVKRRTGIEPASSPWKGEALPLSYHRAREPSPKGGSPTMTVCTNDVALGDLVEDGCQLRSRRPLAMLKLLGPRWSNSSTSGSVSPQSTHGCVAEERHEVGGALGYGRSLAAQGVRDVPLAVRCSSARVCRPPGRVGSSCRAGRVPFGARRSRRAACVAPQRPQVLVGSTVARTNICSHDRMGLSAAKTAGTPAAGLSVESTTPRGVAQSGSAPGWGPGGRRFKSCLPDRSAVGCEGGLRISLPDGYARIFSANRSRAA